MALPPLSVFTSFRLDRGRFFLGPFLHTVQLVTPVTLKRAGPFMEGPDGFCIRSVKHPATIAAHVHESHIAQDTEVLRNGRLLHAQGFHNIPNGSLSENKISQNISAPRFGNGIEGVRGCCSTWHDVDITFPYGHMSS